MVTFTALAEGQTIYTVAGGVLTSLWGVAGPMLEAGFANPVTAVPLAVGLGSTAIGLVYCVASVFRRVM